MHSTYSTWEKQVMGEYAQLIRRKYPARSHADAMTAATAAVLFSRQLHKSYKRKLHPALAADALWNEMGGGK